MLVFQKQSSFQKNPIIFAENFIDNERITIHNRTSLGKPSFVARNKNY
jgi:hypothetical protein